MLYLLECFVNDKICLYKTFIKQFIDMRIYIKYADIDLKT